MKFEVISYSSKAGMAINCDSVAWLDREDCVTAVICTAADDTAESVLKAKQLSGDAVERIYPCSSAEEAEEVCKAVDCSGVEGAVTLAVRDDCAVWQCFGSAAIYLFSDGKIQKTAGEKKQVCGKKTLKEGDALLLCSKGFYSHISDMEMDIDLHRAKNAADWLENMLVRQLSESGAAGKSISLVICLAKS